MRFFRRYRTLHALGIGRVAAMRAAWRVEYGRIPEQVQDWPEP